MWTLLNSNISANRQCLWHCPVWLSHPSCCTSNFVDIKAVGVPSLWHSCLFNIGEVAATPYPRLQEPKNCLVDSSNDESFYPVVDWVNSYKPLFSSQGEYSFTFSYRRIMNSNRAPKQWSLKKNETIRNHYYIRSFETICNIPFHSMLILPRF